MLSLDPGKTTGWAVWNDDGVLLQKGQGGFDEVCQVLQAHRLQAVVYEDFRLYKHKAEQQSGSSMEASQVIGMAKFAAFVDQATTWAQEVGSLRIASMHSGLKRPGDHSTGHWMDAVLHGYHWFERNQIEPDVRILQSAV